MSGVGVVSELQLCLRLLDSIGGIYSWNFSSGMLLEYRLQADNFIFKWFPLKSGTPKQSAVVPPLLLDFGLLIQHPPNTLQSRKFNLREDVRMHPQSIWFLDILSGMLKHELQRVLRVSHDSRWWIKRSKSAFLHLEIGYSLLDIGYSLCNFLWDACEKE